MRTLRLSFIGTVILALLGGLGAGMLAQDETLTPKLQTGIYYGQDHPYSQQLSVYTLEPRENPRPAVVFFHGGGLIAGMPFADMIWAQELAKEGYVTAMVGYRLFVPDTVTNPWPTQLDDAQRAVKWLRAHANEFNVDPDRICAMGHSSGGQLAGLLGTTESNADFGSDLDGISSRVDCVVTAAGPADLTVPVTHPDWDPIDMPALLGGTIDENLEAWEAASPAYNVDAQTVPFLIIHGRQDDGVPVKMARNLVDALAVAGTEYTYEETSDDHFSVYSEEDKLPLVKAFLADQLHPAE